MNYKSITLCLFVIFGCTHKSEMQSARAEVYFENIKSELEAYKQKKGSYPDNTLGLKALLKEKEINAEKHNIIDPWGNPFHYQIPGTHNPQGYDLWSYGADNVFGGNGESADIQNWK